MFDGEGLIEEEGGGFGRAVERARWRGYDSGEGGQEEQRRRWRAACQERDLSSIFNWVGFSTMDRYAVTYECDGGDQGSDVIPP